MKDDVQMPLWVFDLGNVILNVDFERFARRLTQGSALESEQALEAFGSGPDKAALDRGLTGPVAFGQHLVQWRGDDALSVAQAMDAWADIFEVIPGAVQGLARCRASGPVWLLSDTDPIHFSGALSRFEVVRGFDRYLLSYARGMLKRDPGAFDELGALVHSGQPVVFVDDLPINIEAARAAGVDAILFEGWQALMPQLHARGLPVG